MITQQQKDQIIESLLHIDYDLDVSIPDPVILIDRTHNDDPWIADKSNVHVFECDGGIWDVGEDFFHQRNLLEVTSVMGLTQIEYDQPFMVTAEDDPEFIGKVKMALQFRRL